MRGEGAILVRVTAADTITTADAITVDAPDVGADPVGPARLRVERSGDRWELSISSGPDDRSGGASVSIGTLAPAFGRDVWSIVRSCDPSGSAWLGRSGRGYGTVGWATIARDGLPVIVPVVEGFVWLDVRGHAPDGERWEGA